MAIVCGTLRFRLTGADGAQVIFVGSNQTGQFEDTTHIDAVLANLDVNYSLVTGGGSGIFGVIHMGTMWTNTEPTTSLKDPIATGVIPWAR